MQTNGSIAHTRVVAATAPAKTRTASEPHGETLVRARGEVLRILNGVLNQAAPLSVRFLGAGCTIDSTLIFVDEENGTLLAACTPEWAAMIKKSNDCVMISVAFEDAKFEFQAGHCTPVDLDGMMVVGIAIPSFLWRFQRRRDPRQKVSGLKITLDMGFLEAEAEVIDLSLGGVGLLHCHRELRFAPGERLNNSVITLPGIGRIPVSLVVQHSGDVQLADGTPVGRVGCQFVGLKANARHLIARYLEALTDA